MSAAVIAALCAAVAIATASTPASAQAQQRAQGLRPVANPKAITLDQAFTLAAQNSFDLRIANARIAESEARVRQAWAVILPHVTLGGGYTYSFPEATIAFGDPEQFRQQALLFNSIADLTAGSAAQIPDPVQQRAALERAEELRAAAKDLENTKVSEVQIQPTHSFDGQLQIQLPLFNGRALPLLQNAYSGVDVTRMFTQQAKSEIVYGVARAYYQAAAAQRIVGIAEKQVESARGHRERAQQRVEAGLLTPLAVQRADLDLARAEQQLKTAVGGGRLAKAALGGLIGVSEDFVVVEPPAIPAVESAPDEALLSRALAARDDLRAQKEALVIAQRMKTEAWMRFLPSIALVGTGRATSNTEGLVTNPFTGSVAVQAQIPIFDGGQTLGVLDETDAKLKQEQLRLRQIEQQIEREVRGAVDDLALKRDAVETADRVAALARAQKENVNALFSEGVATPLDVADANLGAFSADVDAARARFDLETARLGLAFTLGELRPVDNIEPLPFDENEEPAAAAGGVGVAPSATKPAPDIAPESSVTPGPPITPPPASPVPPGVPDATPQPPPAPPAPQ